MLGEEKCLEFVFEGRERIRVSDILGEVVEDNYYADRNCRKSESHEFCC